MLTLDETIIAQASPPGSGANGVIRLSGADSVAALQNVFFPRFSVLPSPRIVEGVIAPWESEENVSEQDVTSQLKNRHLPCVLYFWPEGRGFTGQTAVELHTVGSQPVLDAVIQKILSLSTASRIGLSPTKVRLANPGEFTLRAFLSGKIDLTQAEAVLGVIDAADPEHLDVALKQLAGGIARPLHNIREQLLDSLSHLEAGLDFSEEEIEFISAETLKNQLVAATEQIRLILDQVENRSESNRLPHIVLTGLPNAGKSSLYNKLSEHSVPENTNAFGAIVSPTPGTTRDYLKTKINVKGVEFFLVDTAGIENLDSTENNIDDQATNINESAQIFSRSALAEADVVIMCSESADFNFVEQLILPNKPVIMVRTKCDENTSVISEKQPEFLTDTKKIFLTSAHTGTGIAELKQHIHDTLIAHTGNTEVVPATAVRCRDSLEQALLALRSAVALTDELLIASELRAALDALGLVVGAVHTDELLDRIFSRFCIGK
ncbi:MAG: tRNA modification GTPase [Thermoguttaceae bacterium]